MQLKFNHKTLAKIILITIIPVFLVYLPFLLKLKRLFFLDLPPEGMQNIYRNWDGPSYLIVAKSLYDQEIIRKMLFSPLPTNYFTAHFPLFPLLIRFFAFFTQNYLYAGILTTLLGGILANIAFFYFIKGKTKHPLLLTLFFTILPARVFITRTIIAPETWMIFFTLLGIMFLEKEKYLFSSLCFSAMILTKAQTGVILIGIALYFFHKFLNEKKLENFLGKALVLLLPTLSVAILFYFYKLKTGNFFIFFEAQRNNKLTLDLPFSVFDRNKTWVNSIWLEDIIFYLIILFYSFLSLFKEKPLYSFILITYTLFLIFIPQRDMTRFTASILPFVFYALSPIFENKAIRWAIFLTLPAIYLFTLNFITGNQAPVTDWSHFINF